MWKFLLGLWFGSVFISQQTETVQEPKQLDADNLTKWSVSECVEFLTAIILHAIIVFGVTCWLCPHIDQPDALVAKLQNFCHWMGIIVPICLIALAVLTTILNQLLGTPSQNND